MIGRLGVSRKLIFKRCVVELVFKAGITGWETSARMYIHLENTEGKETWEVIGHVKEPISFSIEDELSRGIKRVKRN